MEFYLKCWIPSLKEYYSLTELKVSQLSILSKYILNEDHEGTGQAFDSILKENFQQKNLFEQLTKFDKWFVLTFLRAANVSSMVYIQSSTTDNIPCNLELDLFDLLTSFSELTLPVSESIELEGIVFKFKELKKLYSKDILLDTLHSIIADNNEIIISNEHIFKTLLSQNAGIVTFLRNFFAKLDDKLKNCFLIKKGSDKMILNNVSLKLYDNTLYYFLRSIYLPFCKGLFNKKYKLMKHIGIDYSSIDNLTLSECEIYMNQHVSEENEKKSKQNTSAR